MNSRLHAHIGTLRQLEILLAVYDSGSIKAAAARLHLTQPTVSVQLKKLVEAIGLPIYDQVGRRLVFTDAGKALANTAREVLDSFSHLDMRLSDLRGLKAGTLRIAVVNTSEYFIPHLLGPFCARYPDVDIDFKVDNRQRIIDRLQQAKDDFYVFSHPPEGLDIEAMEFLDNPLIAIAHNDHPLAKQSAIDLSHLAREPFLFREPGSGTRFAIEEHLQKLGIQPNVKMTIASNEGIKHAVMAGLGIAILSAHSLVFGGSIGLAELNVKQLPIETHWYFVWLKGRRRSVIAQTFLNYVQTEGREALSAELKQGGFI